MNGIARSLVAATFVAFTLSASHATAGSVEDIAEAESLISLENMLSNMANRIYDRTDERAKQAVFGTEQAREAIEACKSSPGWLDINDGLLWMTCLSRKPTYRRVYSVLFSKFLDEELERETALQAGKIPGHAIPRLKESLLERMGPITDKTQAVEAAASQRSHIAGELDAL